jgi:hypothetical protein
MRETSTSGSKRKKNRPKTKLGIPDLEHSKAAVLRSLASPDSRRGYQHAIDEFVGWYCSEPRLAFNKTVVLRYRFYLEELPTCRPSDITQHMGVSRYQSCFESQTGDTSTVRASHGQVRSNLVPKRVSFAGWIWTFGGVDGLAMTGALTCRVLQPGSLVTLPPQSAKTNFEV